MKKLSIIVMAISMVGLAHAENEPLYSSFNSWTGFYAGVNAGGVFNIVQLTSQQLGFTNPNENCNINSDFSTFAPGLQGGYMYQFLNNFVSGIEGNVTFNTNQTDTLHCNCSDDPGVFDRFLFRNQLQGSIRARGGYTFNWKQGRLLPYFTTGTSFANVGLTYKNEGGNFYSTNTTQAGWLIGAGIEWSFKQNWSLRGEYAYTDYGTALKLKIPNVYGLFDPNGIARVNLSANSFLVAITYWI